MAQYPERIPAWELPFLYVIPGVRSAPLKRCGLRDAHEFIYACGVSEWQSCPLPPLGAGRERRIEEWKPGTR